MVTAAFGISTLEVVSAHQCFWHQGLTRVNARPRFDQLKSLPGNKGRDEIIVRLMEKYWQ